MFTIRKKESGGTDDLPPVLVPLVKLESGAFEVSPIFSPLSR